MITFFCPNHQISCHLNVPSTIREGLNQKSTLLVWTLPLLPKSVKTINFFLVKEKNIFPYSKP